MKKTISLLATVMLSSTMLLSGCHGKNSSEKSKKDHTPKSSKVAKRKSKQKHHKAENSKVSTSQAATEAVSGDNASVSQTSQNTSNTSNQNNSVNTSSSQVANGQSKKNSQTGLSFILGSWKNSQGDQLNVDENGKAKWTYSDSYSENEGKKTFSDTINVTTIQDDVIYGNLSGFPVIMIPADVANPHDGSVVNVDRVLIGGTTDADAKAYYRS